jgi:GNAT superfamily N-acetyltransferase
MNNLELKIIDPLEHKEKILLLLKQLNPDRNTKYLNDTLVAMVKQPNYTCFALFNNKELIGIAGGWTTLRIYSGKHLELDNVIIDGAIQSKGFGKWFISNIEKWATAQAYKFVGLNTYTQNSRSHKFYYNQGFKVLGFHFQKELS